MDPLKTFPEEILQLIFIHFRGKELLKISTVNFYWNEYISTSKECMQKIELRIGSDRYSKFTENDRKSLVVNRDYQHIRVSEATEMFDYVFGVISSLNNWKSVVIFETDLPTTEQFKKTLETFRKTVESLKLYKVKVTKRGEFGEAFKFEELKSVTISGCDESMFTEVFLNCPSLKTLQIYNPTDVSRPSSIVNVIKHHSNIKKLQIDGNCFNYIFSQNSEIIPRLSLQLQELSIYGSGLLIKRIDDVFINFLLSQSTTLESLYLGDCLGCELTVIQAALQLKALKNLNMFFLPIGLRFDTIDNPKSESIENLDILTIDIDNKDKMKFILKSVPNVKSVRLRTMDEETARFMAENLKSLQRILSVYMKDEKVVREILPNVKII